MERVLGVAIGIAVVCLMLSIIASHVQEVWASFTARRASSLEAAIRSMLGNDDLAKKFFEHPLIETISFSVPRTPGKPQVAATSANDPETASQAALKAAPLSRSQSRPIYIASALFSRVLYATLSEYHSLRGLSLPDLIRNLPASPLKQRLQAIVIGTGNDADACALAIEQWYDGTMDRINGFYKKNTQAILLTLGIILAILCNANLFNITEKLWTSEDARTAVNATAQMYTCKDGNPCPAKNYEDARRSISSDLENYIPVGYHHTGRYWESVRTQLQSNRPGPWLLILWGWLYNLAGWGLTGVAVSLGAPFWFDAVNKLINIRLNGDKPPRSTPPAIGSKPNPGSDGGGIVQVVAPQLNAPVVNVNVNDPTLNTDDPNAGLSPQQP